MIASPESRYQEPLYGPSGRMTIRSIVIRTKHAAPASYDSNYSGDEGDEPNQNLDQK